MYKELFTTACCKPNCVDVCTIYMHYNLSLYNLHVSVSSIPLVSHPGVLLRFQVLLIPYMYFAHVYYYIDSRAYIDGSGFVIKIII